MFTKIASVLATIGMFMGLFGVVLMIYSLAAPSVGPPIGPWIYHALALFIGSVIRGILSEISDYLKDIYVNLESNTSE